MSKKDDKNLNPKGKRNPAKENEFHRAEKWSGGQIFRDKSKYYRKKKHKKSYRDNED